MNVDEAMAYASKDKCFWTGEVHTALETLAVEVERLRAELAAAMAEIESVIRLGPHPVKQVQMPLATFIRSRMVARWEYNALVEKLEKAETELAAAKAASECPVELVALGDAEKDWWHCDVNVKCKSGEDADRFYHWLRDRMKERGEG